MGVLKPLLITGALAVVLVTGAVAGDHYAREAAEDRVAEQVQTNLGMAEPPVVELGGTPFVMALITRELPSATLQGSDVPIEVSGKQISFDTAYVTAYDIKLEDGQIVIGSGRLEAVVGYPALSTLAGVPVEPGTEDGRLQVSYTAELFGRELVSVVSAVPGLADDKAHITLTETRISIGGFDLGEDTAQWIMDQLVKPIDFELPYGLAPESLSAGQAGVTIVVTATDLAIPLE